MEHKAFYTPLEVADFFGVTSRTVYSWIRAGRIKAVKIGQWKIPAYALQAFTVPAPGRPPASAPAQDAANKSD